MGSEPFDSGVGAGHGTRNSWDASRRALASGSDDDTAKHVHATMRSGPAGSAISFYSVLNQPITTRFLQWRWRSSLSAYDTTFNTKVSFYHWLSLDHETTPTNLGIGRELYPCQLTRALTSRTLRLGCHQYEFRRKSPRLSLSSTEHLGPHISPAFSGRHNSPNGSSESWFERRISETFWLCAIYGLFYSWFSRYTSQNPFGLSTKAALLRTSRVQRRRNSRLFGNRFNPSLILHL
jgi:hypothetical protein